MIGLDLADVAVDGCTTKAPCGGKCAGRSPVDRGKGGLKRSQLTDGGGIPLATVSALANTVDHALLPETLDALKDFQPLPAGATAHLDAGYDYRPCREALDERGLLGQIAHRGEPAPAQRLDSRGRSPGRLVQYRAAGGWRRGPGSAVRRGWAAGAGSPGRRRH
jgi:hypothetical protein